MVTAEIKCLCGCGSYTVSKHSSDKVSEKTSKVFEVYELNVMKVRYSEKKSGKYKYMSKIPEIN